MRHNCCSSDQISSIFCLGQIAHLVWSFNEAKGMAGLLLKASVSFLQRTRLLFVTLHLMQLGISVFPLEAASRLFGHLLTLTNTSTKKFAVQEPLPLGFDRCGGSTPLLPPLCFERYRREEVTIPIREREFGNKRCIRPIRQ